MGGLAGFCNSSYLGQEKNNVLIRNMGKSINHRDWHQEDYYVDDRIGLAIIRLEGINTGKQPVFNLDDNLCILLYGNIYDYSEQVHELKRSGHRFKYKNDAEFCLHLYEEKGNSFVKELNGSFVIIIYDFSNHKLSIFNDRYGLRPLYYTLNDNRLLFASEVKAILQDNKVIKKLNEGMVAEFFSFGETFGDKTFFEGIHVLPPASKFSYMNGKISIEQYWDFNYQENIKIPEAELVDQLVYSFRKAVEIRIRDHYKYGVALSGGLDSRSIVGAIPEELRPSITTFTFGTEGCDEVKIAKRVADKAGMNHIFIKIDPDKIVYPYSEDVVHITDGMDTSEVGFLLYAYEKVKNRVDVVFDGLSGDLLLGGSYLFPLLFNRVSSNNFIYVAKKRFYSKCVFTNKLMVKLFNKKYNNHFITLSLRSLESELTKVKCDHPANKLDYFNLKNRVRRLVHLGDVIMRTVFEEVTPTFDNDFIDTILQITPELRFNHRIYQKFLNKLSPELARIPYAKTMIRPDAPLFLWKFGRFTRVPYRLKKLILSISNGRIRIPDRRRYVDFNHWIRTDAKWQRFIKDSLEKLPDEYFNKEFVDLIYNQHLSGKSDHSHRLLHLNTFSIFYNSFFL